VEIKKVKSKVVSLVSVLVACSLLTVGTARAEEGTAVHYSDKFQGRPTASGEIFDQEALTAAHKTLRFGTNVKVTNLENNKSVVVKINDRMARKNSNVIDLTRRAARELDLEKKGRARVLLEVVP
jgi:rare lipoprotein A